MLNPKNELLSPECPGCELMRYAYQMLDQDKLAVPLVISFLMVLCDADT
jgi:hypothetical protein